MNHSEVKLTFRKLMRYFQSSSSACNPCICINYTLNFPFTWCQSQTQLSKHNGLSRPSYRCSWLHPVCSYHAPRHFLSVQAVVPVRMFTDWEPRRSFIDIQHIKHAWKPFLHLLQDLFFFADRKDSSPWKERKQMHFLKKVEVSHVSSSLRVE